MPENSRLVLVTLADAAEAVDRMRARWPQLRFEHRTADAVPDALWNEVEVLYSWTSALPAPERAPRLRWVQLHSAGVDHLHEQPLFHTPVAFTTTSGLHATTIAEYVFAMVLAWAHRVPRMSLWQARGHWPPDDQRWPLFVPDELWGRTIGIAGYGSIGRQVARLAKALGLRVLALHRQDDRRDRGFAFPDVGDPEGVLPDRFYGPGELHAMLAESDIIVITLPLTPETEGLFDEAAFRAMKRSAFLVNVARGRICDEAALARALDEGRIAGAALDVFATEPLPPESPLWRLPNVLLSPHISGFTPAYDRRALAIFEENLRRYVAGEPLLNVVDKALRY